AQPVERGDPVPGVGTDYDHDDPVDAEADYGAEDHDDDHTEEHDDDHTEEGDHPQTRPGGSDHPHHNPAGDHHRHDGGDGRRRRGGGAAVEDAVALTRRVVRLRVLPDTVPGSEHLHGLGAAAHPNQRLTGSYRVQESRQQFSRRD